MIPEAVHTVIRNASMTPPPSLPADESAFFWVEWNEDDDQIPDMCEAILKTGQLSADWDDDALVIVWRGARFRVALTKTLLTSLADNPIVWAANWVLPVSDALLWRRVAIAR